MTEELKQEPVAELIERLRAGEGIGAALAHDRGQTGRYAAAIMAEAAASLSQLVKERDEARAERDASERERKLIANDWIAFCDAMGVQFDTPEAVAYQIRARAEAAERERDALREALRPIMARADKWRHNSDSARVSIRLGDLRHVAAALNLNGGQSD